MSVPPETFIEKAAAFAARSPFPPLTSTGPANLRKTSWGFDYREVGSDDVCVDGWTIDVDVYHEGFDSGDFRHPCPGRNKTLFVQWTAHEMWQESTPDDEIRAWIAAKTGVPADRCQITADLFQPTETLTDEERDILEALRCDAGRPSFPTCVVRNRLLWALRRNLSTPQVLYRLKKLESAGKVERVPSNYAVMICWRVKE